MVKDTAQHMQYSLYLVPENLGKRSPSLSNEISLKFYQKSLELAS